MAFDLLDSPLVSSILFHPRPAKPGGSNQPGVTDGTIPVEDEVVLGYRLYAHRPGEPAILYFHGNGEIAPDYDNIAHAYHQIGVSLLVVDYRGYRWSTGTPLASTMPTDAQAVHSALPAIWEGCISSLGQYGS